MDVRLNKDSFSEDVIKKWNRKTVETFLFFKNICEKHKLTYFCAFGTLIGVVRHHGMIPWDDDIDVCMPRPDFEKFRNIVKQLDLGKYVLETPENKETYYQPHYRFVDTSTTLLFWRRIPDVTGIYIDIYPLDGASNNRENGQLLFDKFINTWYKFRDANSHYTLNNLLYYCTHSQIIRTMRSLLYSLNRSYFRKQIIKKLNKIYGTYDYEKSDYVVTFVYGPQGKKLVIPKKWTLELIDMEFENEIVKVPSCYDKYLKHFYGDYMKIPSEEDRKAIHMIDYYNLDKRETFKEVLKHIKEQGR